MVDWEVRCQCLLLETVWKRRERTEQEITVQFKVIVGPVTVLYTRIRLRSRRKVLQMRDDRVRGKILHSQAY